MTYLTKEEKNTMRKFWMVALEKKEIRIVIPRFIGEEDKKRVVYDFVDEDVATAFAEEQAIKYPLDLVYVMEPIKCSKAAPARAVTIKKTYVEK